MSRGGGGADAPLFLVVGAGLGGSLMAALLGRAGYRVTVLERRDDPRRGGVEAGRSINLAISARGLHALGKIGLERAVLDLATPLFGRMIHPVKGPTAFQRYGARGQAINSVSRADLNLALLEAAERSGEVRIRFGVRCTGVDLDAGAVTVSAEADGESAAAETLSGVIVGADGAYSVVRERMHRRDRHAFEQEYLSHGYKELEIPPGPDGRHRLDPHALHLWPRGGFLLMAMANRDGSFTVTLYLPWKGPDSFGELEDPAAVGRFFEREFPDAVRLLPNLTEAFGAHPTGTLLTIRTHPWHVGGTAVLLGDAAHAIVPFYGQGANAAFEDCLALAAHLERHPADLARAFTDYEAERRPNADAIADLAIANFHEMRDHVASPVFLLRKRAERLLHALFPRWYLPLYSMISFTLIPYAQARARARRQAAVVRWVLLVGLLLLAAALLLALTPASSLLPPP